MHSVITVTRQVHFQAPGCTACQSLLQKWTQASREKSTAVVDIPVIKVPKRLEKKVALTRKVRKDRGYAIPVLMKGRNTLFAAETGSGKTLAYLLPILDSLLKQRDKYDGGDVASPRAVILLPARSWPNSPLNVWILLFQIVAEHLTKNYGINSELLDRVSNSDLDKEHLERPIDLLVATSGKIIKAVKNGLISLRSVHHTVIDETDTLLDDSFKSSTLHILKKMEISQTPVSPLGSGPGSQLILSGATMPKQAIAALDDVLSVRMIRIITIRLDSGMII
ncbi:putative ATP-dependent RNA helicase DDX28 [Apostichopus japonicus]|uniref:Putative ATP-dependent RNA helicase DDX28 n=1 Tax=Stichopus japonicus TaxID=307972 RepID=A0A2G8L709_STIJA|nr:putative ATP-dependent RNA helicase DDX28 [Apostichopus japonicus]